MARKFVRVRMYRVGLGDCFLLSFPAAGGAAHVLIDCGAVAGTPAAAARMTRVAESIAATTGGRLAALVVTNPHWDHVSGFVQAGPVFDRVRVDQVWLPWTEDPADALARDLGGRQAQARTAVRAAARKLAAAADPARRPLAGLLRLDGLTSAAGRPATARAMDWVRRRPGAKVRYFQPGTDPVTVPGVRDVRAYVLGPPRDPAALREAAKSGREVYPLAGRGRADGGFLAAVNPMAAAPDGGQPFDPWFRVSDAEAWANDFFGEHYGFEAGAADGWRRIESDWLGAAGGVALHLDAHANNAGLALAFELAPSGRVLLFPGDAGGGAWRTWAGRTWTVNEKAVTAADLLARTVVYKVGHHGSHPGTPRGPALERMTSPELTALLPVDLAAAKRMDWRMPCPALYRRLLERTNGRILDQETGVPPRPPAGGSAQDWSRFLARVGVRPDWLDYRVEM